MEARRRYIDCEVLGVGSPVCGCGESVKGASPRADCKKGKVLTRAKHESSGC
jgi:hypothetical protein